MNRHERLMQRLGTLEVWRALEAAWDDLPSGDREERLRRLQAEVDRRIWARLWRRQCAA